MCTPVTDGTAAQLLQMKLALASHKYYCPVWVMTGASIMHLQSVMGPSPLCTDLDVDSYLHLRMLYTQNHYLSEM